MPLRGRKTNLTEINQNFSEFTPPSPTASPDKPLSKRQEQNRAAQRAFRERRAQLLKEMDDRMSSMEYSVVEIKKRMGELDEMRAGLDKIRESIDNVYSIIDSMTVPSWTVPGTENSGSLIDTEAQPLKAVLGALRPSSTDPTLTSSPPTNQ